MTECSLCDQKKEECFCQDYWHTFEDDLLSIKFPDNEFVNATSLKPSTITVCFNINTKVNIKNVVKTFEDNYKNHDVFQNINYKAGTKKSKDKELNDAFYNQCSMVLSIEDDESKIQKQTSKINVFVFPNGSFRTVGCRTIKTCAIMINELNCFFKYNKNLVETPSQYSLKDVRISMINSDFKISKKIKQKKLFNLLKGYTIENGGNLRYNNFNPDKYPGINLKYIKDTTKVNSSDKFTRKGRKKIEGEVSILIFRSGSIIITGYKKPTEAKDALDYISNIIIENQEVVLSK